MSFCQNNPIIRPGSSCRPSRSNPRGDSIARGSAPWSSTPSPYIGKDPDAGQDWEQEEKGVTEDEMFGWHRWLKAHEFAQTQGDSEEQGSLVCCSPWDHKEWVTERLNSNSLQILPWSVCVCLKMWWVEVPFARKLNAQMQADPPPSRAVGHVSPVVPPLVVDMSQPCLSLAQHSFLCFILDLFR